jgi:putative oxidoreductase
VYEPQAPNVSLRRLVIGSCSVWAICLRDIADHRRVVVRLSRRTESLGWFGGQPVPLASLFGLAGIIEIVLGLLITIGLLTSYAAFIASGEMAVAYFIRHFPKSFWPLENQGEPAVLFCFIFLFMTTQGSGIWSVDAASGRREIEVPVTKRRQHG